MATSIRNSGFDTAFDKGGSAAVTLAAAPLVDSILIVGICYVGQLVTVSSISNSMTQQAQQDFGSDSRLLLYTKFATGGESATFTVNLSSGGVNGQIWVAEYQSVTATLEGSLDKGSGTSTKVSPSFVGVGDTTLNFLLAGIESSSASLSSPTDGYLIGAQGNPATGNATIGAIHHLSGSTAAPTVNISSSLSWGQVHIAFNDAGGSEILNLRHEGY